MPSPWFLLKKNNHEIHDKRRRLTTEYTEYAEKRKQSRNCHSETPLGSKNLWTDPAETRKIIELRVNILAHARVAIIYHLFRGSKHIQRFFTLSLRLPSVAFVVGIEAAWRTAPAWITRPV
jgi:hypothetical protein